MIPADILPKQITGAYATAYAQSVINEAGKLTPAYTYLEGISLSSTDFQIIYDIGLIIGMPWPVFAQSAFASNLFTFGTNAGTFPITTDNAIGLGDTTNPLIGGFLYDALTAEFSYLPINLYVACLSFLAKTKRYGFLLKNAISLVATLSNSFTINFNASKDFEVHFTVDLGAGNRSALQYAFDYVTTTPRVVVSYP